MAEQAPAKAPSIADKIQKAAPRAPSKFIIMGDHPLRGVWSNMIERCRNPNREDYKWYGARGITVCERWQHFHNFVEDMGERPAGYQLDRKDSDKGYSPENCRWVTPSQNSNNRRTSRYITIDGVTKTLAEWIAGVNVKASTVHQRFYVYKWPIKQALGMEARI